MPQTILAVCGIFYLALFEKMFKTLCYNRLKKGARL